MPHERKVKALAAHHYTTSAHLAGVTFPRVAGPPNLVRVTVTYTYIPYLPKFISPDYEDLRGREMVVQ